MWKIFVGFVVFSAIAMFVVLKGGDKLDMAGEAGGHAAESASASAEAPAPVPAPAAAAPAEASAAAAAPAVSAPK